MEVELACGIIPLRHNDNVPQHSDFIVRQEPPARPLQASLLDNSSLKGLRSEMGAYL